MLSVDNLRQTIFIGYVIDNKDPMMLNRVRAVEWGANQQDIAQAFDPNAFNDINEKLQWGPNDPFLFSPLLPFFLCQIPKEKELIMIIFYDKASKFKNQFYLLGNFTSPMLSNFEESTAPKNYILTANIPPANKVLKVNGKFLDPVANFGIYPEPGDNAILGRGSSDLILKKDDTKGENSVLLRSGKYKETELVNTTLPTANDNRSFIQVSNFNLTRKKDPDSTLVGAQEVVNTIQYLVEWNIINPANSVDQYSGGIFLYQVKPDQATNTKNFKMTSDISLFTSVPIYSVSFVNEPFEKAVRIINKFIMGVNDGIIPSNDVDRPPFRFNSTQFPFAVRPNQNSYQYIENEDVNTLVEKITIIQFIDEIKILGNDTTGCIIVYSVGSTLPLLKPFVQNIENITYTPKSSSINAIGSDKIYLLSHLSQIPKLKKADLSNSIYGISQEQFEQIDATTNSLVRGEQLVELLDLIVKFLVSHVHAYHGTPPVPTSLDGTTTAQLGQALYNAPNSILNPNIRIN